MLSVCVLYIYIYILTHLFSISSPEMTLKYKDAVASDLGAVSIISSYLLSYTSAFFLFFFLFLPLFFLAFKEKFRSPHINSQPRAFGSEKPAQVD